ncbi:hypothetical protein BB559_001979 [Furculomyces boomerangus]|uniref:Ion transport domain-containing protein n=2 Tax=Harpellales TaxID=61421 RepID=A0A2T9YZ42_9FUNG|nr:hypothetical protein BB559_001979 [Furculomyces boomerangus]PVZ98202.1 hypothetical protein BB558_005798 [Smittium angustum]
MDDFQNSPQSIRLKKSIKRFYKYIEEERPNEYLFIHIVAVSLYISLYCINTVPSIHANKAWAFLLFILDFCLTVLFFGEYILCLYASNSRIDYILKPRNIFDLISTIPLFIEMIFITFSHRLIVPLQYIRMLKAFRILELYRFGEANLSVHIAVKALYRSMRQILAALISLVVVLVISSSFMFLAENSFYNEEELIWYRFVDGLPAKSPFQSVPGTFYWAMVTLTTTGYGDEYPVTSMGKFVAGITMMFGVAVIALPTSIIGANLTYEWNNTSRKLENSSRSMKGYGNYRHKYTPISSKINFSGNYLEANSFEMDQLPTDKQTKQPESFESNNPGSSEAFTIQSNHYDEIKSMLKNLQDQIKELSEKKG